MKKLLIALAVLIVIIAGGVALFLNYGTEPTIKYALESQGSTITDSQVTVDKVNLSLLGGSLSLGDFKLANPSGFKSSDALNLGEARVKLDRKSLFSDQIVIDEILLDQPSLTFERGQGSSNLEMIKKAIERYVPEATDEEPAVTVLVRELKIQGAKLNYNLREGANLRTLSLPDTRVANIGTGQGEDGVSVKVAIDQIVEQMTPVIVRELARAEGVEAIRGLVSDSALGDILDSDALKDGLGGAKELLEKGGGDVLKKIPGFKDRN